MSLKVQLPGLIPKASTILTLYALLSSLLNADFKKYQSH